MCGIIDWNVQKWILELELEDAQAAPEVVGARFAWYCSLLRVISDKLSTHGIERPNRESWLAGDVDAAIYTAIKVIIQGDRTWRQAIADS